MSYSQLMPTPKVSQTKFMARCGVSVIDRGQLWHPGHGGPGTEKVRKISFCSRESEVESFVQMSVEADYKFHTLQKLTDARKNLAPPEAYVFYKNGAECDSRLPLRFNSVRKGRADFVEPILTISTKKGQVAKTNAAWAKAKNELSFFSPSTFATYVLDERSESDHPKIPEGMKMYDLYSPNTMPWIQIHRRRRSKK